ncbi:hypothetical protein ARMGADRAFT_1168012 [Armillaria gallica]|uniref:Protein kinase domain-containing protein n=1 Tax=Armillaria gallica TaxID=47427 RepID=A0A2H3D4A1_ARMGA|nr:hypothetical protein ARMGADRAFT_1168012 [Armillaria gallica]
MSSREIQETVAHNWFELIRDDENWPGTKIWEDWMSEVSTWRYKLSNHNTELAAYLLLHRLQGRYIPRLFGVVRLRISPESTTLHPITDIVQGRLSEYIPGVSMTKLESGVDVSMRETEGISSQVMEALRAIEAENYVLHNVILVGNVVLRDGSRSPVIIDFGQADIREPVLSDEEWSSVIGASPDTRRMRNLLVNPEDGPCKRIVTPYEMSDPQYKNPLVFNEYVEGIPEDFRRVTFERVLDMDCQGVREGHDPPMIYFEKTRLYSGVFLDIYVYVACNTFDTPTTLHTVRFLVAKLESKNGDAKHYHSGRHCRKTSFSIPLLPVFGLREARFNPLRIPAYHDVSKTSPPSKRLLSETPPSGLV